MLSAYFHVHHMSISIATIRQLDENTKARLRIRAAHDGRSMKEETSEILRSTLSAGEPAPGTWRNPSGGALPLWGVELKLPKRDSLRAPYLTPWSFSIPMSFPS